MASVNDLPCADPRCAHPFGSHERTEDVSRREKCLAVDLAHDPEDDIEYNVPCDCEGFVWEHYDEDPDRAWDDHKAGYTDIDGNVLEPLIDEPKDY
jgi:hypothetical protein